MLLISLFMLELFDFVNLRHFSKIKDVQYNGFSGLKILVWTKKTADMLEVGVKHPEKFPTLFMDGP